MARVLAQNWLPRPNVQAPARGVLLASEVAACSAFDRSKGCRAIGADVMGRAAKPIIPRVRIDGSALRALMVKHDMSTSGLALRAGVSPPLIRMFRCGQRKTTMATTAQRIADALGEPVRSFATPLPLSQQGGQSDGAVGRNEESA